MIEDTSVTLDELHAAGFNRDTILAAVDALTRREGEGDDYYRRVAANELALSVKRADIWDNTDPERLAALPVAEQERLGAKYRHALELLEQYAPTP